LAADAEGNVFISDGFPNSRIYKLNAGDGTVVAFAGTGFRGSNQGGGPALETPIWTGQGIAVGADGEVYIADITNDRIFRIGGDGILETFAGNGATASDGDGGPATEAGIGNIVGIAVGPDGSVYLCNTSSGTIR